MKTRKQTIAAINSIASAVFDNGRRGKPQPGCDCEQCFGYCMIDRDAASRQGSNFGPTGPRGIQPLDFDA